MAWLVVWFRNGKLRRSTVCHTERSKTRIANSFNEYAALYNRAQKEEMHSVGIIEDVELLKIFTPHEGLPKRMSRKKLDDAKVAREKQKRIQWFVHSKVSGSVQ